MPTRHVVRPGECLAKIASRYGFADTQAILDDPANAELARSRKNPNVLRPGDVVTVPTPRPKQLGVATGTQHKLQVKMPRKELRVVLRDHEGQPLANTEYELRLGQPGEGQDVRAGTTDGDGLLKERVPAGIAEAELELLGRVLTLRLGQLDPITDADDPQFAAGVQSRLRNLGYDPGPTDGKWGRRTRAALASFQADHDLEIDGTANADTLAKLEEAHGC
jgi:hypothetical protein